MYTPKNEMLGTPLVSRWAEQTLMKSETVGWAQTRRTCLDEQEPHNISNKLLMSEDSFRQWLKTSKYSVWKSSEGVKMPA